MLAYLVSVDLFISPHTVSYRFILPHHVSCEFIFAHPVSGGFVLAHPVFCGVYSRTLCVWWVCSRTPFIFQVNQVILISDITCVFTRVKDILRQKTARCDECFYNSP